VQGSVFSRITARSRGVSLGQVIGEVNQFGRGWVAYFRHAACKTHLVELDLWLRHKLRCLRLKQCKRRFATAKLLIDVGVPAQRAWLTALSGKGWWRRSQSPPMQEGLSLDWFERQGLISLTHRHVMLQRRKKPPDTMSTSGGVGGE
jgi:RNA-directed DNA polymerase